MLSPKQRASRRHTRIATGVPRGPNVEMERPSPTRVASCPRAETMGAGRFEQREGDGS